MARCPFAVWKPISGSSGSHLGGPFKIVHHTTEGSSASGAIDTFRLKRSDPHFTVDATTIYQHIDTSGGARALRNQGGGVQTNRDSAIQIEVVGFAGRPKNRNTLENVARLCRWIEQTHSVPKVWPNGFPRPAINGRDPGGHNRDRNNWDTQGGHYGHCHVPENDHWDPGYTQDDLSIVMEGELRSLQAVSERLPGVEITPEVAIAIDNLNLITYPLTVALDAQGQGFMVLDVAWERVTALIPQAAKNAGGVWETCTASLAEEDGQTLLVVTGGRPEATVTVLLKVLESQAQVSELADCPSPHEQLGVENSDRVTSRNSMAMFVAEGQEISLDLDSELFPMGEVCSDWDSGIAEQALASVVWNNTQNEQFLTPRSQIESAVEGEDAPPSSLDDELCPLGEVCRDWTG